MAVCWMSLLEQRHNNYWNSNLEIEGVLVQTHKDLTVILKKLGEATGETILADNVEICHNVPVANS